MRKWILFCLFGLGVAQATYAKPELRIMALDFPPYEYEINGQIDGISVRIVREAFKRMDQAAVIEMLPWSRALTYLKTGEEDAAFEVLKKPEREAYAIYSNEILMNEKASLFVVENSGIIFNGDLGQLAQYTFGARQDFSYGPVFDNAVKTGELKKIHRLSDPERLIMMLSLNRIDILIGDKYGVPFRFAKLKHEKNNRMDKRIKRLSPDVQDTPAYMVFSKKRRLYKIRDRFDAALRALKSDGTYNRILKNWEARQ